MKLRATIFVDMDAPDFIEAKRQGDKVEEAVQMLKDSDQFKNVEYDIRERRDRKSNGKTTDKYHEAGRRKKNDNE